MTTKRITVWLSKDKVWMATYSGPEAQRIQDLMGTVDIPTAYLSGTSKAKVMSTLAALNPGYEVVGHKVGPAL